MTAVHSPSGDGATRTVERDKSVGALVQQATEQLSELVRSELRLAVAEVKDKGRHARVGAGMFGGAGLFALYGIGAFVTAAIVALARVLPLWASALIVGAALLLIAAALALLGRRQVTQAIPPVPERAIDSAKHDVREIRERAHR
ncbi:phage holin family protein [Actinomadura alba]|uniref:Phage holin family protein n=1 Tax=Actinomadura alba TaxID=406431 RepID=A0ABR7LGN5_9ACTN|nr:phage holin family protein [Actinomadura alba]MBC6463899.1 phage holin family protein [Actinomadura alba]